MIFILLQAAVHVASAVVSLTSTFGTFYHFEIEKFFLFPDMNKEKFQKEKSLNNEKAFVFLMWTIISILNQKRHQH